MDCKAIGTRLLNATWTERSIAVISSAVIIICMVSLILRAQGVQNGLTKIGQNESIGLIIVFAGFLGCSLASMLVPTPKKKDAKNEPNPNPAGDPGKDAKGPDAKPEPKPGLASVASVDTIEDEDDTVWDHAQDRPLPPLPPVPRTTEQRNM